MARRALIIVGILVVLAIPLATMRVVHALDPGPSAATPSAASTSVPPTSTPSGRLGDVTVKVDRSTPDGVSHMATGVTLVRYTVDSWGDPGAVARGRALLSGASAYVNQHTYGWGTVNPEPAPGVFDWSSLDYRINMIRSMHAQVILTLCCAPDWMTAIDRTSSTYPLLSPTPEHYADFADLARRIAQRYPDVHYFQVWNELKGFWDYGTNNWDYVAYTKFYNVVYDALKGVSNSLQVGGPYIILEGSGTHYGDWSQEDPILARNKVVLDYWLAHKHGADYISVDRTAKADHDPLTYPPAQVLQFTNLFETICNQLHAMTNLPVWWSEERFDGGPWNYQAAGLASIMLHETKCGSAMSITWSPEGVAGDVDGGNYQNLFSDTRVPGGGQPFPYYWAFKAFHDDFGPGTQLFKADSSSADVEVLASASHVLLINKRSNIVGVDVNGQRVELKPYEVRVL
jgi:hypothetical protein